jgi:hypothetical protein
MQRIPIGDCFAVVFAVVGLGVAERRGLPFFRKEIFIALNEAEANPELKMAATSMLTHARERLGRQIKSEASVINARLTERASRIATTAVRVPISYLQNQLLQHM